VTAVKKRNQQRVQSSKKGKNKMTLIKKELMDILVCPADKAELIEKEETKELECTKCGRKYPVKEGIPVMLVEDKKS
jgi:uncharacterized protein YbaR (Trm112 family)